MSLGNLVEYVDDVDLKIERIQRLVESAGTIDPELAAGLASSQGLGAVQRKIDQAIAAVNDLEQHAADVKRRAARSTTTTRSRAKTATA